MPWPYFLKRKPVYGPMPQEKSKDYVTLLESEIGGNRYAPIRLSSGELQNPWKVKDTVLPGMQAVAPTRMPVYALPSRPKAWYEKPWNYLADRVENIQRLFRGRDLPVPMLSPEGYNIGIIPEIGGDFKKMDIATLAPLRQKLGYGPVRIPEPSIATTPTPSIEFAPKGKVYSPLTQYVTRRIPPAYTKVPGAITAGLRNLYSQRRIPAYEGTREWIAEHPREIKELILPLALAGAATAYGRKSPEMGGAVLSGMSKYYGMKREDELLREKQMKELIEQQGKGAWQKVLAGFTPNAQDVAAIKNYSGVDIPEGVLVPKIEYPQKTREQEEAQQRVNMDLLYRKEPSAKDIGLSGYNKAQIAAIVAQTRLAEQKEEISDLVGLAGKTGDIYSFSRNTPLTYVTWKRKYGEEKARRMLAEAMHKAGVVSTVDRMLAIAFPKPKPPTKPKTPVLDTFKTK